MPNESPHIDDQHLLGLLAADEDSNDYRSAATHLESCSKCRSRLDLLAGSRALDEESRSMLKDYPWDAFAKNAEPMKTFPPIRGQHRQATNNHELDFLTPSADPQSLGRLGRYEIERVIGRGGMGIVLKAHDSELNRPVAIKVLANHLAHSGAARQRFARESRAAAAVVHEHVVAIHNVEVESDVPFLVMQFVAGESLQARVDREGPLDTKEILRIGIQAAAGLAAAHEQGVIHRDVKPANILLESGVERALLTDFGLARTVDDASLTQTGMIAGTPHYMSPEQANGMPSDHRTDLFSLGVVLYFMATGHPPFRAERAMGVLNRICHDQQRSLWEVTDDVPDELSALVDRLLEKQPSKRLPTAESVREQLAKMLSQRQQPKAGAARHLRRYAMRFPRKAYFTALIAMVFAGVVAASMLSVVLLAALLIGGVFIAEQPPPTILPNAIKAASSNRPVAGMSADMSSADGMFGLDAEEADAFASSLAGLHSRLNNASDPGVFIAPDSSHHDELETLQSLRRRLDRLQQSEPIESRFKTFGGSP
ncbi:MAG: serine/threonine protein kinase [bacterium]|nr:serine/threonine protein kinase [bacterium]